MSEPPLIRCGFGLGNRVAAMANGLSRSPAIRFSWKLNWQCPARHEDLFPGGVTGVEFIDDAPAGYVTRWGRIPADVWQAAGDRRAANAAYGRIMAALVGRAPAARDAISVCARYHGGPAPDIPAVAAAIARAAEDLENPAVFLLLDSHRNALASALQDRGIAVALPASRAPSPDRDRDRTAADLLAYCPDWHRLLAASIILAAGPRTATTSILFPARAAGTPIQWLAGPPA